MIAADEDDRPSFAEIMNHQWLQADFPIQRVNPLENVNWTGDNSSEEDEIMGGTRAVRGANIRDELDRDEIHEEILKDESKREKVNVKKYKLPRYPTNNFITESSAFDIFEEFIKLFKADT